MQSIEAAYIEKFRCDGASCEAYCCKKWTIEIDDKTLSKYKHIKPPAKSKEIVKHIKQKGGGNFIVLNEQKACPFLGEDWLCYIQKNYGETYLSTVCRTYPRANFKISEDLFIRSLTLTCPVACRLVLSQKPPVLFHTVELSNLSHQQIRDMSQSDRGYMLPLLQITGANILQYDSLSFDERLAVLALFMESANSAKNEKELADISEAFENEVLKNAKAILAPLSFDAKSYLKEMFTFMHALFTGSGKRSEAKLYITFINDTFELLPKPEKGRILHIDELDLDSIDYDKMFKLYQERFLPAKKALFGECNELVQNFLVHTFLLSAEPIQSEIPHFSGGILKFIMEYKLAEFVFVCFKYALGKMFHEDGIYIAVQDFLNLFEHHLSVKKAINEKFQEVTEVLPTVQRLADVKC